MKKIFFLFLALNIISCKDEPSPSTSGEIVVQKMIDTKEFPLTSPKVTSTTSLIVWIDGTINSDISIKIYNSTGERFIIDRIIPKGTYIYSTREFRVDYYEAKDVILKIIPTKGSEESFKLKWGIV